MDIENKKSKLRSGIIFSAIGFELVGIMITMLYLGQYVDKSLHSNGIAVALLSFIGLGGWLVHLVYMLKGFNK